MVGGREAGGPARLCRVVVLVVLAGEEAEVEVAAPRWDSSRPSLGGGAACMSDMGL